MHPILFEIGPVAIRSYGVFVALGFFIGFFLLYKEAARENFFPEKILDMELYILIFGIIGARALHVAVNMSYYKDRALEAVFVWRGGLAIYGGLIFGIIAGWVFIVKNKMPLFKTGDLIAPYIALGQSIGRIGCFLNGCCFGKPEGVPCLGMLFPGDNTVRHPTQLYASLVLLGIFVVLKFAKNRQQPDGSLFSLYLVLYSAQRFFIDILRDDTPRYISGLTISQIISIPVFLAGILLLAVIYKNKRGQTPFCQKGV